MATLGEKLKARRKELQLTQVQLSGACKISQSVLQYYEAGHSSPTAEVIAKLCRQLGISSDYLIGLTDDPTPHYAKEGQEA